MLILAYRQIAYKYSIFKSNYTGRTIKKQYFERNKIDTGNYRSDTILGGE